MRSGVFQTKVWTYSNYFGLHLLLNFDGFNKAIYIADMSEYKGVRDRQ